MLRIHRARGVRAWSAVRGAPMLVAMVAAWLATAVVTLGEGVETWTKLTSGSTVSLNDAACASTGLYIAVGGNGTLLSSPGGASPWTASIVTDSGGNPLGYQYNGICIGAASHGVAVGNDIIVSGPATSPSSWMVRNQYGAWLNDVACDVTRGLYVAVGGRYRETGSTTQVMTSNTGLAWTYQSPGLGRVLRAVAFGNGRFVAVGEDGIIASSDNGTTWTALVASGTVDLISVVYGGGRFVVGGPHGVMRTSTDGITWSDEYFGTGGMDVLGLAFGNGVFCAIGQFAGIRTSTDGLVWVARDSGIPPEEAPNLQGVCFANNRFTAVGGGGLILQSGTFVPPPILRITVSPAGGGTTTPTAGEDHLYVAGAKVTVTATAATGYRFVKWSGDATGTYPTLSLTMAGPRAITAEFAQAAPEAEAGPLMVHARMGHATARLADGRVAVFGGHGTGFTRLSTMEVWDPDSNTFTAHNMPTSFDGGALVRLADGRYLLAGGASSDLGGGPGLTAAQIYDPATDTITATAGPMLRPRVNCRGALLSNGKVLIVGGWYDTNSAGYGELFDPATGRFTATGALGTPRAWPLVIPTADGKAVVAGGTGAFGESMAASVELYDPSSNSFSPLATTFFTDDSNWLFPADSVRDVSEQQLTDGTYVFTAIRPDSSATALAVFDPATKQFTKRELNPAWGDRNAYIGHPLVERAAGGADKLHLIMSLHGPSRADSTVWPVRVDPATGERSTSPLTTHEATYWIGGNATAWATDGRIFVTGGTTSVSSSYNFNPVRNTMFLKVGTDGGASVVDTDPYEFMYSAANRRMVREEDGTLHVAYTARRNPAPQAGYYAYTKKSANDGKTWSNPVRSETFPDSAWVTSLALAGDGALVQGLTFNVGSFFTRSSDHGATWSQAVPLHDGGWGDWDYRPALAVDAAGTIHAVFDSTFGWADFPSNVLYRRSTDGGQSWNSSTDLSLIPDTGDPAAEGGHASVIIPGAGGLLFVVYDRSQGGVHHKMLARYDGSVWAPPVMLSAADRNAYDGDAAMDSKGRLHLVWLQTDPDTGKDRLAYAVYDPATGIVTPPRPLTAATDNVGSATLGVYPADGVLIAYDLYDAAAARYKGVFGLQSEDGFKEPITIADHAEARAPGLRWSVGMSFPSTIDCTWVEPLPRGGQALMHKVLDWSFEASPAGTGTLTVTSNVANAPFVLSGPRTYTGTTGAGKSWTEGSAPAGEYTLQWSRLSRYVAPADPEIKELAADGTVTFSGTYTPATPALLTVVINPPAAGTVVRVPEGIAAGAAFEYNQGETVTLTAAAAAGFRFRNWSGPVDIPGDATAAVTLAADLTVTANYSAAGQFFLTTTPTTHGTLTPDTTVGGGGEAVFTFTPDPGYKVADVSIDGVSVGAVDSYTFADVNADHTITVAFTEITFTPYVEVVPYQAGTVTTDKTAYLPGETAQLAAAAAAGYQFAGWTGAVVSAQSAIGVLMDGAKALTATFTPVANPIPGDVNGDGTVNAFDAVKALRMAGALDAPTPATADLTADGQVTNADAVAILRKGVEPAQGELLRQEVPPSAVAQTIWYKDEICVTIPGNLLAAPQTLVIKRVPGSAAGGATRGGIAMGMASAAYDIKLGNLTTFSEDIFIEMDYNPANLPGDAPAEETIRVRYYDETNKGWVETPCAVDAVRHKVIVPTGHLSYFEWMVLPQRVSTDHFVIYAWGNDPPVKVKGEQVPIDTFAQRCATYLDTAYHSYQTRGFPVADWRVVQKYDPRSGRMLQIDNRCGVYLEPTDGASYNPAFKNFAMDNRDYDKAGWPDVYLGAAHELFHMVQNQVFNMWTIESNIWVMDATCEYASRQVVWNETFLSDFSLVFTTAMTNSTEENHRYMMGAFLAYLIRLNQGNPAAPQITFAEMWARIVSGKQCFQQIADYVQAVTKMPIEAHYHNFLLATLTNAAWATEVQVGLPPVTLWSPADRIALDETLRILNPVSMGVLHGRLLPKTYTGQPVVLAVEVRGGVPAGTMVNVFRRPAGSAQAGGIPPSGAFGPGTPATDAYTFISMRPDDYYLVTAFGFQPGRTVDLRLTQVTVDMTPAVLSPAEAQKTYRFTAQVRNLPECVGPVEVEWDFKDGTDPYSFLLPVAPDLPFSITHKFLRNTPERYDVEFTMRDRRRHCIVARGICRVDVIPATYIRLSPPTTSGPPAIPLALALGVQNPPVNPVYTWDFGDNSPVVTTAVPSTTHPFAVIGKYVVSVTLADASAPGDIMARTSGGAYIEDGAEGLARIEEKGNCLVGMYDTYIYYALGNAKVRYGKWKRYFQAYESIMENVLIEEGEYAANRKEATWKRFSLAKRVDQKVESVMNYVADDFDGPVYEYRNGRLVWSRHYVRGVLEGRETYWDESGAVTFQTDWPSRHPLDQVYTIEWPRAIQNDPVILQEQCAFVGGKRHGAYKRWNAAGILEAEGSFTQGVKTGVWKYYSGGFTFTTNYGN